ncbi:hypothetical protein FSOLCH5_005935 [Fusarium solani]
MELSDIFRIVNLAVGVITLLGGITHIFQFSMQPIIVGCYMIVFGLIIGLLEFQIPPQVSRHASFPLLLHRPWCLLHLPRLPSPRPAGYQQDRRWHCRNHRYRICCPRVPSLH